MNTTARIVAIVCAIIVLLVALLALTSCAINGLGAKTETYEISDTIENLSIKVDTSDITVCKSDDGKIKVVCVEKKANKHAVKSEGDTLVINSVDETSWYNRMNMFGNKMSVTVYLPEGEYSNLNIERSTGDLDIRGEYSFTKSDIFIQTIICIVVHSINIPIALIIYNMLTSI